MEREAGAQRREKPIGAWEPIDWKKAGIVILLIWAIVAPAALAWYSYSLYREAQIRAWNHDAVGLITIGSSFWDVSFATGRYLDTGDYRWGQLSVEILAWVAYWYTVRQGITREVAAALGITSATLYMAVDAYQTVRGHIRQNPQLLDGPSPERDFLVRIEELSLNLSELLLVEPNGTNPLVQLGDERIASIRSLMSELCTLSDRFGVGTPCEDV